MNILAHVHGYPPHHNAGAEWMLHSMLRWMIDRGHKARVIVDRKGMPFGYTLNRVEVVEPSIGAYQWSDVVITHLDLTQYVIRIAQLVKKPCIHLVHNQWQLDYFSVKEADLVIFNSHWLAEKVDWQHGPMMVLHPPVWVKDYETKRIGDYITLVNLTVDKGVTYFLGLAREMRHRRFLGVQGSYGVQIPVPAPNISYVKCGGQHMRDVYAETRILLMPSTYESFGRVAIEAACSGIPTIASPTPGLKEALGGVGIFIGLNDARGWFKAIEDLDDRDAYEEHSRAVRDKAVRWENVVRDELVSLESSLMGLV